MADSVTAQEKPYPQHDEGQYAAVCADVIDLGLYVERYQDKPPRLVQKCVLVFVTNTPGEIKEVSKECTVSMGEKASLRILLEAWRGKGYSPEQAAAGIPLDKLEGNGALLSVEHYRSQKGKTYARIRTIAPLPKEITAPELNGYKRAEFWVWRKKKYAEDVAAFKGTVVAKSEPESQPVEDDDDLPF